MEDNIRLCNHCNNVTSHQLVADGYTSKTTSNRKEEAKRDFTYFFIKCDTCGEHSLLGGFNDQLPNPKLADIPILFPKLNLLDSSVPKNIRRVYEETIQLRKNPNAYATQIRRALEYLCLDKEAKGKDLYNQLNYLVEIGIIPSALNDMTDIIRLVGNIGAHAKEDEVTLSDVKDIDDFFQFIIEYIYVAPAKTKQVRFNLDRRQLISEHGDLLEKILELIFKEDPRGVNDEYKHKYGDGYGLEFEYENEAIKIAQLLLGLHTKEILDMNIYNIFDLGPSWPVESSQDLVNNIWDLWEAYKRQ